MELARGARGTGYNGAAGVAGVGAIQAFAMCDQLIAIVLRCLIHQGPSSRGQSQCVVVAASAVHHGPSWLLRSLGVP